MINIIQFPQIHPEKMPSRTLVPTFNHMVTKPFHMYLKENSPVLKYILAWIALPLIAVFNGVLRELTYAHMFGDHLANQISSVLLSTIIVLYVISLNSKIRLRNASESITVGITWLFLTIGFEIILGLLLGVPLIDQLQQYNLAGGNLWVLVLISVFLSPILLRRFRVMEHAR